MFVCFGLARPDTKLDLSLAVLGLFVFLMAENMLCEFIRILLICH